MKFGRTPAWRGLNDRTTPMSKRTARSVETQKKKSRRAIPRAALSRNQGNTGAGRGRLKKAAGLARVKKATAEA